MKRKRLAIIICFVLACAILLCSCQNLSENETPQTPTTPPEQEICEHSYEEDGKIQALALKNGEQKFICTKCGDKYSESIPATKSIKILAIGNSFTVDSMHHLWDICKDGGAETVVLGNLYIGNCTLDTHWRNINQSRPAYKYYKNTNGTWSTTDDYKVIDALKQEEWDYIVLHQTSGSAGQKNTFGNLDNIINFVNSEKTNPEAKIVWHMPWAYQSDSTHAEFPKYGNDQIKMYNDIKARVDELILTRDDIFAIIPSGTAIQNLRTSYIGDNVARDGYHLNYGFGRYTASLVWYAVMTGGDIDIIDWVPAKYPDVGGYLTVLKEAAKNAMAQNYSITTSLYPTVNIGPQTPVDSSAVLDPRDYVEGDIEMADMFGIDLNNYTLLTWGYKENSYWVCTSHARISTPGPSSDTYNQNICTDKKFSVNTELPVGTVFVCDPGWRYRLEIFPNATDKYTGTRPDGSTCPIYVLTEEFLNGCTYISWDVSTNPKSDISNIFDQAYAHIRVYVPNNS